MRSIYSENDASQILRYNVKLKHICKMFPMYKLNDTYKTLYIYIILRAEVLHTNEYFLL